MGTGAQLRAAMADGLVVAPFVYDGFTARMAERAGFSACYMTGHGTAAQLGFPDVGLISFAEMVANVRYVAEAVSIPVIADADTGYGNVVNVGRTVREYERAGAAALHMEDQEFPKKCGFFEGKRVIPRDEAVQKVRAALGARTDPDFVIIARTDALAPNGWDDAVERATAYHDAGADLVFVDGIKTPDDLDRYTKELVGAGVPCLYNGMLEPTGRIAERGFSITITGGGHGLSFLAVRQALLDLKRGAQPQVFERDEGQFDAITSLMGLPEIYELERRYSVTGETGG